MGIIEIVKRQERQRGLLQGIREGRQEGIREGRKEGLKDGELKKALDIARAMKEDGLPIEQIAKFTKLSIKEIEKL